MNTNGKWTGGSWSFFYAQKVRSSGGGWCGIVCVEVVGVDEKKRNCLPLKPCKQPGCAELVRGGGYCAKHKKTAAVNGSGDKRRRGSEAWHYLYNRGKWGELRAMQLLLQPFCVECAKAGRRRRAEEVDHITPHKGDEELFFNVDNLQSLCKSCHSRKTIAEQRPQAEKGK